MNIFERAARAKLRYPSPVGELSTEQLWDLPLTARGNRADLDSTARAIHNELKSIEEGSFVNLKPDPRKTTLELKLEIVKHVIASKISDMEAAEKAAATKARKEQLLSALAHKQEQDLMGMSKEQIEKELEQLGA